MSVHVSLDRLRVEIERFTVGPYLITVSEDETPHCVAVNVSWVDEELALGAGNHTRDNAAARPGVSLLWPPASPGEYSLIVDATVTATRGSGRGDNEITVRPTRAVLHRPAAASEPAPATECGADCVPVLRT